VAKRLFSVDISTEKKTILQVIHFIIGDRRLSRFLHVVFLNSLELLVSCKTLSDGCWYKLICNLKLHTIESYHNTDTVNFYWICSVFIKKSSIEQLYKKKLTECTVWSFDSKLSFYLSCFLTILVSKIN